MSDSGIGAPVRSCINYAVACDGSEITTIEGFGNNSLMNRLRRSFSENHASQCGFCTPGQFVSARGLPGAEIDRVEGNSIAGRFRAALGPITSEFHGNADIERNKGIDAVGCAGPGERNPAPPRPRAKLPIPSGKRQKAARSTCRSGARSKAAWHSVPVLASSLKLLKG